MKLYILFVLLFISGIVAAQEKNIHPSKGDFPEGIYMTLEDVLNKNHLQPKRSISKPVKNVILLPCRKKHSFYFKQKNKRVKVPLAVSHKRRNVFSDLSKIYQ